MGCHVTLLSGSKLRATRLIPSYFWTPLLVWSWEVCLGFLSQGLTHLHTWAVSCFTLTTCNLLDDFLAGCLLKTLLYPPPRTLAGLLISFGRLCRCVGRSSNRNCTLDQCWAHTFPSTTGTCLWCLFWVYINISDPLLSPHPYL